MSDVSRLLDLCDPSNTARKRLLTRLACFADEDLHRRLRAGEHVHGHTDLADLIDCWDDDPRELAFQDGTLGPEELQWLIEFNDYLDVHYWSQTGFAETDAWSWLYDLRSAPPEVWHQTVRLAQRTLGQFSDFDLTLWRESGYRIW